MLRQPCSPAALRSLFATFSCSVNGPYFGACALHLAEGGHSTSVVGLGPVKKTTLSRPCDAARLFAAGAHPMSRRAPAIVGPYLHQISDVDGQVARLGGDGRPDPGVWILNLQPPHMCRLFPPL